MTKDDLIFFLNVAADLSGHPATGPVPLAAAQAQIKEYLKQHTDLNDPAILVPVDRLLKISAAAQVAGTYVPASYDPTLYVDPEEPAADTQKPWKKKKHWQSEPTVEPNPNPTLDPDLPYPSEDGQ